MQAPIVPQAIDTHLQQQRTLKQREAIEGRRNRPSSVSNTAVTGSTSDADRAEPKKPGKTPAK
jgi:hypothetical protein